MPFVITHDFFGKDVLDSTPHLIGASRDERNAFLLGSQGPDPLFFLAFAPRYKRMHTLATTMHRQRTALLLASLKESLALLDDAEKPIGRAYADGFLCHYALDSMMHPLIYHWQYALCDAGTDGLSRKDGHEVHGVIETEYDEMMLFTRLGITVASFSPAANILLADDFVLRTVQKMYAFMALRTYGLQISSALFPNAVRGYRRCLALFWSPTGQKRAVLASMEELVRPYSMLRSMSHRPLEVDSSKFENSNHNPWENPFTHEESTESFRDIYAAALKRVQAMIAAFNASGFDEAAAHALCGDVNFHGEPIEATLIVHER